MWRIKRFSEKVSNGGICENCKKLPWRGERMKILTHSCIRKLAFTEMSCRGKSWQRGRDEDEELGSWEEQLAWKIIRKNLPRWSERMKILAHSCIRKLASTGMTYSRKSWQRGRGRGKGEQFGNWEEQPAWKTIRNYLDGMKEWWH